MVIACCEMLEQQLNMTCPQHDDLADCPDSLVARWSNGDVGLRVHDGGKSMIVINVCPWCGTPVKEMG